MNITPRALEPLTGEELFVGVDGEASVKDFWRFALPDLRVNNARGWLGEFLVARALGQDAVRREWDDYDVRWGDVTIEVKTSAYLQSWPQRQESRITFTGLRTRPYDSATATFRGDRDFKAQVYVFGVQTCREPAEYEPLDVGQWKFYVLSRARLVELDRSSLSLDALPAEAGPVPWAGLRRAVAAAARAESAHGRETSSR